MLALALLACRESITRAAPVDEQEQQPKSIKLRELALAHEATRLREEAMQKHLLAFSSHCAPPSEVIYQEYKDGKLTYEVTAPPAQIRALGMPPVMLIRPLDCPDAPRPPAKPRSKSGQRRAHTRWG